MESTWSSWSPSRARRSTTCGRTSTTGPCTSSRDWSRWTWTSARSQKKTTSLLHGVWGEISPPPAKTTKALISALLIESKWDHLGRCKSTNVSSAADSARWLSKSCQSGWRNRTKTSLPASLTTTSNHDKCSKSSASSTSTTLTGSRFPHPSHTSDGSTKAGTFLCWTSNSFNLCWVNFLQKNLL